METKIIFVYNAKSGFINGFFGFFHKVMKPSTYKCDLCIVTHNHVGMRKAWSSYLNSLSINKDYLHKDEFAKLYPESLIEEFPSILLQNGRDLEEIVSEAELKELDLAQLTFLLESKLVSYRLNFTI